MKTHEKTLLAAGMPAECVYFLMSPVVSGTVPPPKLHGFALEVYQLRGKYPNRDYPHIFKAQIQNLEPSFWALSRTQKMRFVASHSDIELDPGSVGYDNVWQCMTMYDMWIQAPPWTHHIVAQLGPLRRQQTLPCRMLAWVQRPRSSLRKPRRCWSATQDVFLQWPIHIYIYIDRWYFDISNGIVTCQNIPSI